MFLVCPQQLYVGCNKNCQGGAKHGQPEVYGCYSRIGDVNDEPAWKKGSKAIWWDDQQNYWAIGDLSALGGKIKRVLADSNANCPNLIGGYDWKYYDGSSFVRAERSLGVFGEC